ncbi:MAG: DUF3048 domain-containing protein [Anaerolineales bacterium]|nr:DUF3048 domain-containing protein [Anaerolineales bacterium]
MTFRPIKLIGLVGLFLFSCASPTASPPDLTPATVPASNLPTPTPFQPQTVDSPDPYLALTTPQAIPTFTPYPTKYVIQENVNVPVEVNPSAQSNLVTYNPLTGLAVSDPTLLQRRPLAIKIGNSPDYVRPQSGLSLADLAFEYYIEYGDTRFIAVFYSNNAERVGPVRSGRYFDEHVTRMYHSFFMFKGADPRELNYLKATDLNEFLVSVGIGECPPYFIGPYKRDSYNNVFFNMLKWNACVEKKSLDNSPQTISGGFFSEESPQSPLTATRVYSYYSAYSYNYWEYDPLAKNYIRYQEAKDLVRGNAEAYAPLTDDLTGFPITAENVVVIFVPHIFANPYNSEDEVYNIDLIDYGNAFVYRDGLAIPAYWIRAEEHQPLLLTTLTGEPIYLRPGQTFYQVLGATSTYTNNGTEWRFEFRTP